MLTFFAQSNFVLCRSQWPRSLMRGSAAAHLLGLWVQFHSRLSEVVRSDSLLLADATSLVCKLSVYSVISKCS
jgi:hypothetical protein